jgi:pimeloyl-ACP methyl ester carboxylesterase
VAGGSFTNNMDNFFGYFAKQKILEHKDILFLDPRGCGNSKPTLCENLNDTEVAYPGIFGRTEAEIEALLVKAVEECCDSLVAANIDPRAYSSVAVAHDIELLRKEMGYRQWIVRGHFYGS